MTAQINRKRPIVTESGSLTQYGWEVLQSIWVAIGGATSTAPDAQTAEFTILPGLARAQLSPDATPGHAHSPVADDVLPKAAGFAPAHDVAPT